MKISSIFIAATLVLVAATLELVTRKNPAVARIDIQRQPAQNLQLHEQPQNKKRQKTVEQTLDNLQILYYANVSLGTPIQNLRLLVSTSTSDTFVNVANSSFCLNSEQCRESGVYNAGGSSTYKYVNRNFSINFADGTNASGNYAQDTLAIGRQTVPNMQFALAINSSSSQSVLGLGYASNAPLTNATLLQRMVDSGKINSKAYSLWLNDVRASTGSILFGGVDRDKYYGNLTTLPFTRTDNKAPLISLKGIGQNGRMDLSNSSTPPLNVLLSAGASLTYLPSRITSVLYERFNATYMGDYPTVDCKVSNQGGTVDFYFDGVNISVPLTELVLGYGVSSNQPECIFGIALDPTSGPYILGETFLRSAYVVYDIDNNQISLAQTKFNVTTENIQEIKSGPNGLPTAAVSTPGTPRVTTTATGTASNVPGPTNGLSPGAKAGIALGAVFGVAILAGIALLLLRRRKKTKTVQTNGQGYFGGQLVRTNGPMHHGGQPNQTNSSAPMHYGGQQMQTQAPMYHTAPPVSELPEYIGRQ